MTKEEIKKELEKRLEEQRAYLKMFVSNGKQNTHYAKFTQGAIDALEKAIALFN